MFAKIMGLLIALYGLLVLIGAAMVCPAKHASTSTAFFMLLTGLGIYAIGRELDEIKKKSR